MLPELDVYGIKQMTMEQLFTRLLYEDWDDKKYSIHAVSYTHLDVYKRQLLDKVRIFLSLNKLVE